MLSSITAYTLISEETGGSDAEYLGLDIFVGFSCFNFIL